MITRQGIPTMTAPWIWSGDEAGYDDYREARHQFTLTDDQVAQVRKGGCIELSITADALYQVWINGRMLGHGPAKSAKGTRGVDVYDLAAQVASGLNRLDVLVLNLGAGTMCYCMGKPGLRFEVRLDEEVLAASGPQTLMRASRSHQRPTVRRWMLPCIEDVDAAAPSDAWVPASVVERALALYPRRVPLPAREPLTIRRIVAVDRVKLPTFSVSFRHKPYLVSPEELPRNNNFDTPAWLVTDIVSPVVQTFIDENDLKDGVTEKEVREAVTRLQDAAVFARDSIDGPAQIFGGALAIGVADRVMMLQYSIYSVISPEGCASILWKSADKAESAAEAPEPTASSSAAMPPLSAVAETADHSGRDTG